MKEPRLADVPVWFGGQEIEPKRLDPMYYDPALTVAERLLRADGPLNWKRLRDVGRVYNFGAYELTNHIRFVNQAMAGAVPFVTVTNIVNLTVDFDAAPWIDRESHQLLSASKCFPGTVLLSIAGTIGRAGIVPGSLPECNANQAIAKIRVDPDQMDEHFLVAYLSSPVGQGACAREAAGAVQKNLYIYNVEELPVPCSSRPIRTAIGNKVRAAERLRESVRDICRRLDEVFPKLDESEAKGSATWLSSVSFNQERLEAQYYETKYLQADSQLGRLGCQVVPLGKLARAMRHGASITGEGSYTGGIRFIRGLELLPNRISNHNRVFIDSSTASDLSMAHFLKPGEMLITRSGTVGVCAVAREREAGCAFGSFVIIVRLNESVPPEYVAAFLNSPLGQIQFRREENGAVQMNINNAELARLRVPLFDEKLRESIASMVQEMNEQLDRTDNLTNEAIQDVEDLIEGKLDEVTCLEEGRKLADEFGLEMP